MKIINYILGLIDNLLGGEEAYIRRTHGTEVIAGDSRRHWRYANGEWSATHVDKSLWKS